jgi:hypothetical protein
MTTEKDYENYKNGDMPVFARPSCEEGLCQCGMNKREYFAGLAMQGDMSDGPVSMPHTRAKYWLECADALLMALEE